MRLFKEAFIVRLVMAQVRKIADQVLCVLFEIRLQLLISLGRHRRGVRAGLEHGGEHFRRRSWRRWGTGGIGHLSNWHGRLRTSGNRSGQDNRAEKRQLIQSNNHENSPSTV